MPLRLQLYRWQKTARPQVGQPAVWAQYLAAGRQPYSSTVYATIRPQREPEVLPVKFPHRPTAAHHAEEGRLPYERLLQDTARGHGAATNAIGTGSSEQGPGPMQSVTTNLPPRDGGTCLIPNEPLHTLPGGANGATAISISPDGSLLAIALEEKGHVMLAVHALGSGRRRMLIHAHHRTAHELCWSADSVSLLSVSADGTAKLWPVHFDEASPEPPPDAAIATLSHPSFVYCARMQPKGPIGRAAPAAPGNTSAPRLVLTGCNDCALRLWDVQKEELLSVKTQHKARINCVAWPSESLIFSADANGVVKQWELIGHDPAELKMVSSIEKKELDGVPLNSIALHPNRRRLLLQTRKNQLLALDTRLQHFSARYVGNACSEYHIRASYSPDGRYVVAGSEDGRWYLWAEESGELLLDGLQVGFTGPLLQVAWSPTHHVIALCGYGEHNPVVVYTYKPGQPGLDPRIDQQPPPLPGALSLADAASGTGTSTGTRAGIASAADASALSAQRSARREARKVERSTRLAASAGYVASNINDVAGAQDLSVSAGAALQRREVGEDQATRRKAAAAEARARDGQ